MERKCEVCGGELMRGELASMYGIFFYPEGETKKFKPKRSLVLCECCKACGNIQGFKAKDPSSLQ